MSKNRYAELSAKRFRTEPDKTVPRRESDYDASCSSGQSNEWQRLRAQFVKLMHKLSEFVRRSEGCANPLRAEDAQVTEPFKELDDRVSSRGETTCTVETCCRVGHREKESEE